MLISEALFSFLVVAALAVTAVAPVVLAVLFLRDLKKGTLW